MAERESRVKDGNFITIQSFMVKELGLKGNELLAYAIIYGFSQDEQWFNGSLGYLEDWMNTARSTVFSILKSLVAKGILEKEEYYVNNVKLCKYRAVYNKNEIHTTGTDFGLGGSEIQTGGGTKFGPNNIDNNIEDILNIKKELEKEFGKTTSSNYKQEKKEEVERLKQEAIKLLAEANYTNEEKKKLVYWWDYVKPKASSKKIKTNGPLEKLLAKDYMIKSEYFDEFLELAEERLWIDLLPSAWENFIKNKQAEERARGKKEKPKYTRADSIENFEAV